MSLVLCRLLQIRKVLLVRLQQGSKFRSLQKTQYLVSAVVSGKVVRNLLKNGKLFLNLSQNLSLILGLSLLNNELESQTSRRNFNFVFLSKVFSDLLLLHRNRNTSAENKSRTSSRSIGVPALCLSPKLILTVDASG